MNKRQRKKYIKIIFESNNASLSQEKVFNKNHDAIIREVMKQMSGFNQAW
jgi:ABC-type oligopeptide transport system ATPase subunit